LSTLVLLQLFSAIVKEKRKDEKVPEERGINRRVEETAQ
jgi:hypothetical protein